MIRLSNTGTSFRQVLGGAWRKANASNPLHRAFWFLFAAILVCGISTSAQVRSNIAGVNLAAILNDSISVSASPGQVNFALVANGVVTGNPTLSVNTAWVVNRNGRLRTFAYFSSSTAALSDGVGDNIPSSSVSASINGGAFQTFTGNCPFAANTCVRILNQRIRGRRNRRGANNSSVQLRISTVGLSLRAGTYVGVLHIRAQAF